MSAGNPPPPSYDEVVKGIAQPSAPDENETVPPYPMAQSPGGPPAPGYPPAVPGYPPQSQGYGSAPYPPQNPSYPYPYSSQSYGMNPPPSGYSQVPIAPSPSQYSAGQGSTNIIHPTVTTNPQYSAVVMNAGYQTTPAAYGYGTANQNGNQRAKKICLCIFSAVFIVVIIIIFVAIF